MRDISGGALPTALEAADDTGSSANDFDAATSATPTNFAGGTTSTAGVAAVAGGTVTFTAAPGVANRVTVTRPTGFVDIQDRAPVSAGAGCQQLNTVKIRCPSLGVVALDIDTGDLADIIETPNGLDVTIDAGSASDRITTLNGDDDIAGGDGKDTIKASLGADDYDGGSGTDTVTYSNRSAANAVTVTMGSGADDGGTVDESGGRRDDVMATVERVIGGDGPDSLNGGGGRDQLIGGPGTDDLNGFAGGDIIRVADGEADTATCGSGNDRIFPDGFDIFPVAGANKCEQVL